MILKRQFLLSLFFTLLAGATLAQEAEDKTEKEPEELPAIAEHVEGMQRSEGFFPFYWDDKSGSILLEIQNWDREFLHVHSLATGLGSNPVGLDRGKLGSGKVVHFRRIGPKILLIQRNMRFRAITDNQLERDAVEQSFAQSVIWGGKIVAETDGTALVDVTDLLMSDLQGVAETLMRGEQGEFKLAPERSAVYWPSCKAFPDNTELESTVTYVGDQPGEYVRQTTPTPKAITLRQHHSFIRLPDNNYKPRQYDVRSPCIFITFADYAAPLDAPLQQRLILRHRLEKKNPGEPMSEPVEPIVYYVDSGAPKQIQEALVEGASWWSKAFEAAGFKDAFQVKLLPPNADPLDVRYNVIQWVHRSTRGWSYGGGVIDPRTGEIIKGHVTLGSLRVRQDQLLFNGLAPVPAGGTCACCGIVGIAEDTTLADFDQQTDALKVALARIRQLSAHEVGHTLGFVHNFAASTYGDRASVMDYPAPLVKITDDGNLDLSDAYGVGIGEWDILSVKFAYSQFADGANDEAELDNLFNAAREEGMIFISDADARPASAAHPLANLWDNGSNPVTELRHVMRVRQIALDRFDPKKLPSETTTADIAQYFTPLFLHHRYQLQAVGKIIGGSVYEYGSVEDTTSPHTIINPAQQKAALEELLATIEPSRLTVKNDVLAAISPRPYSAIRDQEIMPTATGRIFDPLAAARVATDLTLDELLQPQRLARLTVHSRIDPDLAPEVVVEYVVDKIWANCGYQGPPEPVQIGRVVREALLDKLINLVDMENAAPSVRSAAMAGLQAIMDKPLNLDSKSEIAFRRMLNRRARQVLERPYSTTPEMEHLNQPPGSPIGSGRLK